jgi:hypothetical protein
VAAEVDRVEWDDGATFPDPTGASMELARDRLEENHLGENWREGWTIFGAGDTGTPGARNECCITIECYYEPVDLTDAATARESLHGLIDDHVLWPFPSASWEILELADEAPGDPSRVLDVYKNALYDLAQRSGLRLPAQPQPVHRSSGVGALRVRERLRRRRLRGRLRVRRHERVVGDGAVRGVGTDQVPIIRVSLAPARAHSAGRSTSRDSGRDRA